MIRIRRQHLLLAVLLLALLLGNVVLTHNLLTAPYPGHNDFLSRWEGARSFWVDGLNPYGEQASLNIQMLIYGRPSAADEDPGYFVYPFYMVLPLLPLVYLPYAWASALWMVILEVCLIAGLLIIINMFGWRPRPWLLAFSVLWTLLMYYSARGLLLGQVGIVVYIFQVIAFWAVIKDADRVAGVALAFATLKPQMSFLIVPFLLLWALRARHWGIVVSFAVVMTFLLLISFLLQPSWLEDWITQMRLYPQYTSAAYPDTGSPVWIVMQHYLGLGDVGEWAINVFFFGFMLWAWYEVLVQGREERFLWALMVTLTITHVVALRTATTHFVVFIVPLVFYLKRLDRRGSLRPLLALLALLAIPWLQFVITLQGRGSLEHPSLFLPPTFGLALLLWFTRRDWWKAAPTLAVRPSSAAARVQLQRN